MKKLAPPVISSCSSGMAATVTDSRTMMLTRVARVLVIVVEVMNESDSERHQPLTCQRM